MSLHRIASRRRSALALSAVCASLTLTVSGCGASEQEDWGQPKKVTPLSSEQPDEKTGGDSATGGEGQDGEQAAGSDDATTGGGGYGGMGAGATSSFGSAPAISSAGGSDEESEGGSGDESGSSDAYDGAEEGSSEGEETEESSEPSGTDEQAPSDDAEDAESSAEEEPAAEDASSEGDDPSAEEEPAEEEPAQAGADDAAESEEAEGESAGAVGEHETGELVDAETTVQDQIVFQVAGGAVSCAISEGSFVECGGEPGEDGTMDAVGVFAEGNTSVYGHDAETMPVYRGEEAADAQTLEAGQSIQAGDFECTALEDGVSCVNTATESGFRAAGGEYTEY